jgi:hypothetical protein
MRSNAESLLVITRHGRRIARLVAAALAGRNKRLPHVSVCLRRISHFLRVDGGPSQRIWRRGLRNYGLGSIALPLSTAGIEDGDAHSLAAAIGALGYPGFRHSHARRLWIGPCCSSRVYFRAKWRFVSSKPFPWLMVEYDNP